MHPEDIAERTALNVQQRFAGKTPADVDFITEVGEAASDILRAFVALLRAEADREEDVFSENAYNALADRIEGELGK